MKATAFVNGNRETKSNDAEPGFVVYRQPPIYFNAILGACWYICLKNDI